MAVDHVLHGPQGRPPRAVRLHTATKDQRAKASRRGFIATNRMRAKLWRTKIEEHGGMWCHVRNGEVVARFADLNSAADALT